MPISHDRKLIFIHIPKTGGTSIEKALDVQHVENFYSYHKCFDCMRHVVDLFQGDEQKRVHAVTPQHLTAAQLKVILGSTFGEYEKFAVVRNPYDRMVSQYCYTQRNPDMRVREFHHLNFKTFLQKTLNLPEMVKHSLFDSHLNPQYSFLYDFNGLPLVKNVFRFETLIDVFNRYNLTTHHEFKSNRGYWKDYYTPELKELVYNFYKEDFDRFGYTTEPI